MKKVVLRADRKHSDLHHKAIILDQGKQQTIFILLFTVLYLLRDLAGASVPDIVFSGLCAVAFILMEVGTSLGIYMFTSALTVPHNEIVIVYIAIMLAKVFLTGKLRLNGRMLMMTLGAMFLQLLNMTIFSALAVGDLIYDYVTRMLIIIVPLFWYNDEYSAEDFRNAMLCYVAGVILGGTVTMILTAEYLTWEVLLKGTGGYRLGITWKADEGMQTNYNANQLAVMFAISASIIVQNIDKKKTSKILGIVLLGYMLFLTVLTRSRTGLLMMAMIVVVYYLILVVRRKKLLTGLLLLGVVGGLIFAIATFIPDVVQGVVDRFVEQEDITNGRGELFGIYLKEWSKEPWGFLFGYGIGSFFNMIEIGMAPHNSITDILICWGLVGLILVFGIVGMCFNKGIKKVEKNDRVLAVLPAMVALVAVMGGQYLITGYPHTRLCFLFLAAKSLADNEKTNDMFGQKTKRKVVDIATDESGW